MNFVAVSGRLTKDPEIRMTPDGLAIARYTLAVDRPRSKEKKADFFDCKCFGKNAEFVEKYLKKGTKVLANGSMCQGEYTNKDGQQVHYWELVVDHNEFCESKKQQEGPKPISDVDKEQWMASAEMGDDELPFNF